MRLDAPEICIIGLGYIGLPTAALLASRGLKVTGVDLNPTVVATVNAGQIHIVEPDLEHAVNQSIQAGNLTARTTPDFADIFLIAVPTPLSSDKKAVVDHVYEAAEAIAPYLKRGNLIILESTSPVGTTERICEVLAERRKDLIFPTGSDSAKTADISVAYCPERVLPGRIMKELINNDRCVGGVTSLCASKARQFYELFVRGKCVETSARTAEMVKLTENAFRDLNIAFANELSMICDKLDVNVWEMIELANRHPRVNILKPGPGVGGHCIAVDPWFIVGAAPEQAELIRTAREVNDNKTSYVLAKLHELVGQHPDRRVLCLGLSFKANVDDLRESPALEIVENLAERYGDRVDIVEPFIKQLPERLYNLGANYKTLEEALSERAILVLLVDHDLFRDMTEDQLEDRLPASRHDRLLHDTRGILSL